MRTSEQINELAAALIKAHAQFKPVIRSSRAQVAANREYKYADLATLIEATFPALLANGIVPMQAVDAETQSLVSRLCHVSGQWAESAYPLGKYDRPQDFGSQLSYARRYSLLALLGVAQEDDDGAEAQKAERQASPRETPREAASRPAANGHSDGLYVKDVTSKKGSNAKGSWTAYTVHFSDGAKASTFSDSMAKLAAQLKQDGMPCERVTERKGDFLNLTELRAVADEPHDTGDDYGAPAGDDPLPF
jgi:hypothetical protein